MKVHSHIPLAATLCLCVLRYSEEFSVIVQISALSQRSHLSSNGDLSFQTTRLYADNDEDDNEVQDEGASPMSSTTELPAQARLLKDQLMKLAQRTSRGFKASGEERKEARKIIFELAEYNPTADPARAFYESGAGSTASATIVGKWTLVYTDAPDITFLEQNLLAKLGRIGQECDPPYLKNVIEWKRPTWAASLPFSGDDNARVIQKVVTEASATPDKPAMVKLDLTGVQVETDTYGEVSDLQTAIQDKGLVAGLLQLRPIDAQAPIKTPFGDAEILYLDDDLRIQKTGQNYIGVNIRMSLEDEWF